MWNNYDYYHPTIKAEYDKKHNWYILMRGKETFYDEENRLRVWDTKEEALEWARVNQPRYRIVDK